MDDDTVSSLLFDARTRELPPTRLSAGEISRMAGRRRRQGHLAVLGATAAVVAVAGGLALAASTTGSQPASRATPTFGGVLPSGTILPANALTSALDAVSLPAGAMAIDAPTVAGLHHPQHVVHAPALERQSRYATTTDSASAAVEWFASHPPAGYVPGLREDDGDGVTTLTFAGPSTTRLYGPELAVSVAPRPGGSEIRVDAWTIPVGSKPADVRLPPGEVVALSLSAVSGQGQLAESVAIAGQLMHKIADDVAALPVDPGITAFCTTGTPDQVLRFTTSAGTSSFIVDSNCRKVAAYPVTAKGTTLSATPALLEDLKEALQQ